MSQAARLIWVCAATATLLFVALAVLSKTAIEPAGLAIFDSRLGGYSPSEARALLAALNPAQVATYQGQFRLLDTIFPVLLTVSLCGGIWLNTPGEPGRRRLTALAAPCLYLLFDLMENAGVGRMLERGATMEDAQIVQIASYTQAKWACLALSLLVVFWAWRFAQKERHA